MEISIALLIWFFLELLGSWKRLKKNKTSKKDLKKRVFKVWEKVVESVLEDYYLMLWRLEFAIEF